MVPELRRVGAVLLLAAGALASPGCSCGLAADGPLHEQRYEQWARGIRFLVPAEHWPGETPILGGTLAGGRDAKDFSVQFRSGWLAAHVPGFRPILNGGHQGTLATVSALADPDWLPGVNSFVSDLWHGRGQFPDRVVTGQREPNTGLHIVEATPGGWRWFLTDRPPRPDEPIPTAPPWRTLLCGHNRPLFGEVAYTECKYFRTHVTPRIVVRVHGIASENLRVRSAVIDAIAREVLLWRLNGAVREGA